ncbi:MAG: hypothetical protein RLZZ293_244 [Pseudomonadota bacterium]|jgi:TatD DNase family protein
MQVWDSHCHLNAVINNSTPTPMAIAAIELADIINLANYRNQINYLAKIGIGIHPWYIQQSPPPDFTNFINLINLYQPNFIGEVGLDKLKQNFPLQLAWLEFFLNLANHAKLPIVIHCVHAYNELLAMLKQIQPKYGAMVHGYNANSQIANQLKRYNVYLGIGSLCLNPKTTLNKVLGQLPLTQLLVESDAPYAKCAQQTIIPNCQLFSQIIAQTHNLAIKQVNKQLNHNFLTFFYK